MRRGGLWRSPDFLKLWVGQAVSQIGSRITRDGLPLTAVLLLGASPFQMGILSGAAGAAILVFGLFAGAWADRLRRRPILIVSDLGRAAILTLVPLLAAVHRLRIGHLYVIAAAAGILTVFFDVSYQAYLPSLVSRDSLLEGNSKLALTESVAEVVGPGLTGILVQTITAPVAILFDALSFVCSAISVWWIAQPEPAPAARQSPHIGREIVEGLAAAWREPILRALMARIATASIFMGFFSGLYIIFAIRELRLSAALVGLVISVGGATNLFGALIAERLARRFGIGPVLIGAAAMAAVASLLVPLARGPALASALILSAGQLCDMAWPIYSIHERSLRQAVTPAHLLGRVNSAMLLMFRGVLPLGSLIGGAVAQVVGVRNTLFAGGLGFLLSTLWLVFSPVARLREIPPAVSQPATGIRH